MIPTVDGWHAALAALLFLAPQSSSAADDLPGAARELARKTVNFAGPRGSVSATYRNLSSLPEADLTQVRREFESALPAAGADNSSQVDARLTLSENDAQLLLVEEARKGEESQVWISSWRRSQPVPAGSPGIALEKRLIWEQDEQILDVVVSGDMMAVLSSSQIGFYTREGSGGWKLRQSAPITSPRPWPRDMRGHMRIAGSRIQARLPGIACEGAPPPGFSWECKPGDEPWVLESGSRSLLLAGFRKDRNFFEGSVTTQNGTRKSAAPFYSAAAVEEPGGTSWLLALVDGRTQVYDGSFEPAAAIPGWGSDIAGITARCAGGSPILATRAGDATEPDSIQAFAIVNHAPVSLGASTLFPGPVTALWRSSATSATAVARDVSRGKYAAYEVTLACGP
jgi:hypothetical protein